MTAEQILADQGLPFRDFPTEYILYNGRRIKCLVLRDTGDVEWMEGGRLDDSVMTLAAERSQFETANVEFPKQGMVGIGFRSKSWRIGSVTSQDEQASFQFDLVVESK